MGQYGCNDLLIFLSSVYSTFFAVCFFVSRFLLISQHVTDSLILQSLLQCVMGELTVGELATHVIYNRCVEFCSSERSVQGKLAISLKNYLTSFCV